MGKSRRWNRGGGVSPRLLRISVGLVAAILLNAVADASAAADCAQAPAALGRYSPAPAGRSLPAAAYVDADGTERPLAALRGQPLVVNFWATWCAPCVEEMPALDRLAGLAGSGGPRVLTLSADREGAPVVRKFYDVNQIANLPVALDRLGRVARALGITGLPTTVLFDRQGNEVGRVIGVAQWDAPETLAFLATCLGAAGEISGAGQ